MSDTTPQQPSDEKLYFWTCGKCGGHPADPARKTLVGHGCPCGGEYFRPPQPTPPSDSKPTTFTTKISGLDPDKPIGEQNINIETTISCNSKRSDAGASLDYRAIREILVHDNHPLIENYAIEQSIEMFLTHPKAPEWLAQLGYVSEKGIDIIVDYSKTQQALLQAEHDKQLAALTARNGELVKENQAFRELYKNFNNTSWTLKKWETEMEALLRAEKGEAK